MDEIIENYAECQLISKDIQLKLLKGELDFNDERVQFFIPLALHFTDFDWLKIVAENTLVDEDEQVVKNFLDKVEALMKVNSVELASQVADKLKRMGLDFND